MRRKQGCKMGSDIGWNTLDRISLELWVRADQAVSQQHPEAPLLLGDPWVNLGSCFGLRSRKASVSHSGQIHTRCERLTRHVKARCLHLAWLWYHFGLWFPSEP